MQLKRNPTRHLFPPLLCYIQFARSFSLSLSLFSLFNSRIVRAHYLNIDATALLLLLLLILRKYEFIYKNVLRWNELEEKRRRSKRRRRQMVPLQECVMAAGDDYTPSQLETLLSFSSLSLSLSLACSLYTHVQLLLIITMATSSSSSKPLPRTAPRFF